MAALTWVEGNEHRPQTLKWLQADAFNEFYVGPKLHTNGPIQCARYFVKHFYYFQAMMALQFTKQQLKRKYIGHFKSRKAKRRQCQRQCHPYSSNKLHYDGHCVRLMDGNSDTNYCMADYGFHNNLVGMAP